ncbi:MAG: hypothetical protein A2521_10305 [Deltaproteobacteria bacterium RIFOXYD12_FULL_57_12]|nr:MAG: hypothetical protein A2521_10305 [Deltaproteobacteria bacterium RIFOXYD12_FULL_57_12]
MKKILIAVDDTKSSKEIFSKCMQICKCMSPEEIILLYVEKFEGKSLIDEMLGDAELGTLKEVLEGTEYKEALDRRAANVLNYYKGQLAAGVPGLNVRTEIKSGHPAEQIVAVAKAEDVSMILIGSRGQRAANLLFMGSVSREVANTADRPVLIVK